MKTIYVILIIITLFSCRATRQYPDEFKIVEVDFVKVQIEKRWIDGKEVTVYFYMYRDQNGGDYKLPRDFGNHYGLPIRE